MEKPFWVKIEVITFNIDFCSLNLITAIDKSL